MQQIIIIVIILLGARLGRSNTGKSLSEAFVLTSTNPQYDRRLFIDLPVQYMKTTSSEHGENMLCAKIVLNVKTKTNNNTCKTTCSPDDLSL